MTRDAVKMSYEEMIDTLKSLVFGTFDRTTVKEREALDMAIKALEQEPILDKIKADIVMYEADCRLSGDEEPCKQCNDNVFESIYRIIDKYKMESEDWE